MWCDRLQGRLAGFDAYHKRSKVCYDDGQEEWLSLAKERFRSAVLLLHLPSMLMHALVNVHSHLTACIWSVYLCMTVHTLCITCGAEALCCLHVAAVALLCKLSPGPCKVPCKSKLGASALSLLTHVVFSHAV